MLKRLVPVLSILALWVTVSAGVSRHVISHCRFDASSAAAQVQQLPSADGSVLAEDGFCGLCGALTQNFARNVPFFSSLLKFAALESSLAAIRAGQPAQAWLEWTPRVPQGPPLS